MLKGMPRPKGMPAKPPRGSVLDALDALESRRRKPGKPAAAKGRRGDLDLGSIR
jgi:hypothetical protein